MDILHMDVAEQKLNDKLINRSDHAPFSASLRNNTILLISPQPWDHIAISKHHYARELAARDNEVYFVEPPDPHLPSPLAVQTTDDDPRIHRVSYRPTLLDKMRFHAYSLYKRLIKRRIRYIQRHLPKPVDVVWSFDPNRFPDLCQFDAHYTIFHPVDPLTNQHQIEMGQTADIVLTVSKKILTHFDYHDSAHFINHGLAKPFESVARKRLSRAYIANQRIKAGYAGNLMRTPVNREIIKDIVSQNSDVEFHFWGPYSPLPNDGVTSQSIARFIQWLEAKKNVHFRGTVAPDVLAEEMQKMDLFFLAYSLHSTESDRSNSHKLLEYLSTGRLVISSRVDTYKQFSPELILMPESADDRELPTLFQHAKQNISRLNNQKLQDARIQIALANRYADHLDKIEKHLTVASPRIAA
ncbi:MAG: glycosyltransferase [Planctomycetota bacterium]|nr:glycosyltransferase [Planctomycetota bacterium]